MKSWKNGREENQICQERTEENPTTQERTEVKLTRRERISMHTIKIGLAPTRRSIFSAPAAVEYAGYTRAKLRDMGVEFVDIDDIADDGLLHDDVDRLKIQEKFLAE